MSLENVHDLVVRGKAKLVPAAVQETLDEGVEASKILDTMISAMDVVGENFKNGTIFVPEMLIAAKAMKKGVEVLKPHLASGAAGALGKVIIGTVAGIITLLALFRMFSRNLEKRRAENAKFMEKVWWPISRRIAGKRQQRMDKEHCYFTCPGCGAVCRVPRGKGRIVITCPRCGNEIHGKS